MTVIINQIIQNQPSSNKFVIIKLQFKLMSFRKELLSVVSNITQLILQSRSSHQPQLRAQHLVDLQNDLSLLSKQHAPSPQFLQFLVQKPSYAVRQKLDLFLQKHDHHSLFIQLEFVLSDKLNSLTEAAQIWKIGLSGLGRHNLGKGELCHQMIHLVSEIVSRLQSDNYFNNLLMDKQSAKNYVFDYQIHIRQERASFGQSELTQLGSLYQIKALLNSNLQMTVHCLQRKECNSFIKIIPSSANQQQKSAYYKPSEDTSLGDSNDSRHPIYRYRCHSSSQLFDLYDQQLEVTIISSQNGQIGLEAGDRVEQDSHTRDKKQQENIFFEQTDSFELLIEDAKSEEEEFVDKNEHLFIVWERQLMTIFS